MMFVEGYRVNDMCFDRVQYGKRWLFFNIVQGNS